MTNREQYNWNPVYSLIIRIKDNYINNITNDESSVYEKQQYNNCIEKWVSELNIKEYNDFLVPVMINQSGNLILVKYDMIKAAQYSDMWINLNSIYREARSIVIDVKEEKIVLCPFRKFFNINEVEENKIENIIKEIKDAEVVEIANKLDCSLQNATYYNKKIILTGSQSLTAENSWRVKDGYEKLTENYKDMLMDHENLTFSFENINIKDRHVVNYKNDDQGLYLIGVRDNLTGYQYSYTECKSIADEYGISMTEIEDVSINDIIKLSKKLKGNEKEGWVIYIRSKAGEQHLIKLKTEDYVNLSKVLDKMTSLNTLVESIVLGNTDDLLSKLPEEYKEDVLTNIKKIISYKEKTKEKIDYWYSIAPKQDTKSFMIWIQENVEKDLLHYLRCKFLNKPYNVLCSGSKIKKYKDLYLD